MPEMPEVEVIRRYLDTKLRGRRIESLDIFLPRQIKYPDPNAYKAMCTGQKIANVNRRGKYLLLELSNGVELVFHLRMTGRLVYHEREDENDDTHTRLIFHLDGGSILVFGDTRTFGALYALDTPAERWRIHGLATLGPEPLTEEFSAGYLWERTRRSHAPIKSFLLNQTMIAGIGNIYADEALFLAKIHPLTKANALTQADCEALQLAVDQVIADGIRDGGTTFRDYQNGEGKQGLHQEHLYVYNREGEPCRRCGTKIEKIKVGGRGTHFCPHCQEMKPHA